jgi:hypothetical protein
MPLAQVSAPRVTIVLKAPGKKLSVLVAHTKMRWKKSSVKTVLQETIALRAPKLKYLAAKAFTVQLKLDLRLSSLVLQERIMIKQAQSSKQIQTMAQDIVSLAL